MNHGYEPFLEACGFTEEVFAIYSLRDTGYHGGGPQGWGLVKAFSNLEDALDFMDGQPGVGGRRAAWSEGGRKLKDMPLDWICVEAPYPHPEVLFGGDSTDIIHHLDMLRFRRHPNP